MMTVRHIERLCTPRDWARLLRELLCHRPEYSPRLERDLHSLTGTVALAMIRLDELGQSHTRLYARLLRTLIASQEPDGGWRDPATTALCVRALMIDRGRGAAIDNGLRYLAMLQKDDGAWPKEPLRRMPADALTSAFILFHLGDRVVFRHSIRLDQALGWCQAHGEQMDDEAARLWRLAALRCRREPGPVDEPLAGLWSRRCA